MMQDYVRGLLGPVARKNSWVRYEALCDRVEVVGGVVAVVDGGVGSDATVTRLDVG